MTTSAPSIGQRTGAQRVASNLGLYTSLALKWATNATYATYRKIRTDPTVAMARALCVAPILAAEWTVEAEDYALDGAKELIEGMFLPLRPSYLEAALYFGNCDYGWQGFEKIFDVTSDGWRLRRLKPLLQDLTTIETFENGAFAGFTNGSEKTPIPLDNSLLVSWRVEGTDWTGSPLLENVRQVVEAWNKANEGAERYDAKIAGAHWIVYYPIGSSVDATGTETDNLDLARGILAALESSGTVAVPASVSGFIDTMNDSPEGRRWKIDILDKGGTSQAAFVNRLDYLDKLKARGMLMPERTILEGQHGTLAEAEAHQVLPLLMAELWHQHATTTLNWHAVDQVLALNYGDQYRGSVSLKPSPVIDEKRAFLQEVVKTFLANPSGFIEVYGKLDTDALFESTGLPKAAEPIDTSGLEAAMVLPVDASTPLAASVRRLYREVGVKTA